MMEKAAMTHCTEESSLNQSNKEFDLAPPMEMKIPASVNSSVSNNTTQSNCETIKKKGKALLSRTASKLLCLQEGIELTLSKTAIVEKDLLVEDFYEQEIMPVNKHAHIYRYSFRAFAPRAFTYLRYLFKVDNNDFKASMCSRPLISLEKLGRSGSAFFTTFDNRYIVKTVQEKETKFVQRLLPQYIIKLQDNPGSFLPRYYGLYSSKFKSNVIRVIVMSNLFPNISSISQQYDLKGSTYGRTAVHVSKATKLITFKDLDFLREYPQGLYLDGSLYHHIVQTIENDCNVLQSFNVMDYSLLIGIEMVDGDSTTNKESESEKMNHLAHSCRHFNDGRNKGRDIEYCCLNKRIEARNTRGEKMYLYIGIIDILQNYDLTRKAERFLKSAIYGQSAVSVINPDMYSRRFQKFISEYVFNQLPAITSSSVSAPYTTRRKSQELPKILAADQGIHVQGKSSDDNIPFEPGNCSNCPVHRKQTGNSQSLVKFFEELSSHENFIDLRKSSDEEIFHDTLSYVEKGSG